MRGSSDEPPAPLLLALGENRVVPASVAAAPLAAIRFFRHMCLQWAAALAYNTIAGLVPLLAALFSLAKGVNLHAWLTPFLVNTVGAGSPEIVYRVVSFIDETNVRTVGVLSSLGALVAAFGILSNAELCFNAIWGGVPSRPFLQQLAAFLRAVVLVPLLLILALVLTALLQSDAVRTLLESLYLGEVVLLLLRIIPYALLWAGFTALYKRLPNTHVTTRSAVVGAVVAGTLWQLAQWTYVNLVIGAVKYSTVYGALWQLPILIAWIYVAWTIVLIGAEVSRAHQEVVALRLAPPRPESPPPDTAIAA